jgi:hypothetical protein
MQHPLYRPRPSITQLWRGCILVTIAEALHSANQGTGGVGGWYSWWENGCYLRDDGSGDHGALAFSGDRAVAVFFAHESNRSPWSQLRLVHDFSWYFRGMPPNLRSFAERTVLPYTELWSLEGEPPCVTAAFWGQDDLITAAEPWPDLFWHGVAILHTELQEPDTASYVLRSKYSFSALQTDLLQSLYNRKVTAPTEKLILTRQERALLIADRPTELPEWQRQRLTGGDDDQGVALCRELLSQIGIIVP